jgi:hypothetical protein
VFDVILEGTSPFLMVSHRLLGVGSSVRSRNGDLLWAAGMVWCTRVCFGSGVVVMGVVEVTMLHAVPIGELEHSLTQG